MIASGARGEESSVRCISPVLASYAASGPRQAETLA